MKRYDVVVIGAGIAGLECASILTKEGMSVLLIEQGAVPGGFFQPFRRRGVTIDSSVHYIGSLDKGQFMERFFSYLGIMEMVDFVRMDNDQFESVCLEGEVFPFAMGHSNFVERLAGFFPKEKNGLQRYADAIKSVSLLSIEGVRRGEGFSKESMEAITTSVGEEISYYIKDVKLRRVLMGNSIIYLGDEKVTPFYVHAMTNNSYIESSWRIRGGAHSVTEAIASKIKSMGGEIRCSEEVKSILVEGGKSVGIETKSGERILSERVISTIHPVHTSDMLGADSGLKESYRKRVAELKNSPGMFCLYLIMKQGQYKYINRNFQLLGEIPVMVSMQPPQNGGEFAEVITLIAPMLYDDVAKWSNSKPGQRGDEYCEFKKEFSDKLIKRAEVVLPGLNSSIEYSCSASPLTFRDYIKTPMGSVYGVVKDCKRPLSTFLPVKSRVENLYLAGQSINLHGVMGVTFTSLLTCSEILGGGVAKKVGL